MNLGKLLKKFLNPKPTENFVSDIDQFFAEFDQSHQLSASQRAEVEKHARIAHLRDNAVEKPVADDLWEGF